MINLPTLEAALKAIGDAHVYYSTNFTQGNSWQLLGVGEGEPDLNAEYALNKLTAPKFTGEIFHQAKAKLNRVTFSLPMILGEDLTTLWPKINPIGGSTSGGGHSTPQDAQTLTLAIIPAAEIGAGLSYDGTPTPAWKRGSTTGAEAAPQSAIWLWRVIPSPGNLPFNEENGGRVVTTVTFEAGFMASNPEGEKVFSIGDPIAKGITTLRISEPAP